MLARYLAERTVRLDDVLREGRAVHAVRQLHSVPVDRARRGEVVLVVDDHLIADLQVERGAGDRAVEGLRVGCHSVAEVHRRPVLVAGIRASRRDSRQDASERHVRLRVLLREPCFRLQRVRVALASRSDEHVEGLERQRGK